MASVFDSTPAQSGRRDYVVTEGAVQGTFTIHRNCPFCRQGAQVTVPGEALWKWEHGAMLQDAFPMLDASEREIAHTGIHPKCWDDAFPEDEIDG